MRSGLPTVIFSLNLTDPITHKVMGKLAQKEEFKDYCYFEPVFKEISKSLLIDALTENATKYKQMARKFRKRGLDIHNPDDRAKYFAADKIPEAGHQEYRNTAERHDTSAAHLHLLQTLKLPFSQLDGPMHSDMSDMDIFKQKQTVARARSLLSSTLPGFGASGIAYTLYIQEALLASKHTVKELKAKFLFFNIHSKPALPELDYLESKVRNGQIKYPLGMICIDATKHSIDEIVALVIQHAKIKQAEIAQLLLTDSSEAKSDEPTQKDIDIVEALLSLSDMELSQTAGSSPSPGDSKSDVPGSIHHKNAMMNSFINASLKHALTQGFITQAEMDSEAGQRILAIVFSNSFWVSGAKEKLFTFSDLIKVSSEKLVALMSQAGYDLLKRGMSFSEINNMSMQEFRQAIAAVSSVVKEVCLNSTLALSSGC